MIELVATGTHAIPARTIEHDRLDHLVSRIATGDRAAFRSLYAFMAIRVWRAVAEAPLCPAVAVAVIRSTFVEVWHSAGAAARYDARDWMTTITAGRVNDRLRIIDANGRHGVNPAEPGIAADRWGLPPTVVDYDAHIHRELIALLGAGGAIIRTSPGVFARVDDLDHALVTIATATRAASMCSCASDDRSDWVDRELPELVDTSRNAALLKMLGVDPAVTSPDHVASRQG